MKTIVAILATWLAGAFCFGACWAVLLDKGRRKRQRESDSRELGEALLKIPQEEIEIYNMPQSTDETQVEPCWKLCVYKHVHDKKGLTKE